MTLDEFKKECETKTIEELKSIQEKLYNNINKFNQMLINQDVSNYIAQELKNIILTEQEYANYIVDLIMKTDNKVEVNNKSEKPTTSEFNNLLTLVTNDFDKMVYTEIAKNICSLYQQEFSEFNIYKINGLKAYYITPHYDEPVKGGFSFITGSGEYLLVGSAYPLEHYIEEFKNGKRDDILDKYRGGQA